MSIEIFHGFPQQRLSDKQKGKQWRRKCVDFADAKGSTLNSSPVRKSFLHKKINYDLINMKLHIDDIQYVLNPNKLKVDFIPDSLQHYPTINPKLNVLRGEALSRVFDWHVVVTNPNSISDIENTKKEAMYQSLQNLIESQSVSEEDFQKRLTEQNDYFTYQYQDMREVRANELLRHYYKEYSMKDLFDNHGIMDAMIVKEEIYLNDIIGGEPIVERVDPMKLRVFRSGNSNRIEDADMLVYEDYKSIGWVRDTYYDVLTPKDLAYLDKVETGGTGDDVDIWDDRNAYMNDVEYGDAMVRNPHFFSSLLGNVDYTSTMLPYDSEGNMRVLRVYWKSARKIKKIKYYDYNTGEEDFKFVPQTYVTDTTKGEEEEIIWVNEAWEGTKIGTEIYVNIRPRPVQYFSMSNPSRCHFGIIGQLYNIGNTNSPSLVDTMKPYSYMYDAVFDRLYKLIESNLGKLTILDLSFKPDSWTTEKWLYFAKTNHLAVKNSFNEGKKGAATGKIAGALNNNSTGVIDASVTQEIQYNIQLLDWLESTMSKACGISPQREGQISNRETVGGVERATLQSSHITEWLFAQHENLKKRELECFIETAKIALKGRKKKFEYITSEGSRKIMEIDGDEFAENDYGLIVDNSQGTQALSQKLETLAQAGLQNQLINFSTMMKLYSTDSIAEKIRMIESSERRTQQQQEEAQQQQMQLQQQQLQAQAEQKQLEMEQRDVQNQRDNDTRILVAKIQAQANIDSSVARASGFTENPMQPLSEKDRAELLQRTREFDEKNKLEHEKLQLEREKIKSQERISLEKQKKEP